MASVRREGPERLSVTLRIPDPWQLLALLCGCLFLCSILGAVGWVGSLGRETMPAAQKIGGLVMLVGTSVGLGFVTAFGLGQTWTFDRQTGRIGVRRAGIVVRTEPMAGLHHLELHEIDDDDGGAFRADLVYVDRPSVPLNRVNTGNGRDLRTLVDAVNQFLAS